MYMSVCNTDSRYYKTPVYEYIRVYKLLTELVYVYMVYRNVYECIQHCI